MSILHPLLGCGPVHEPFAFAVDLAGCHLCTGSDRRPTLCYCGAVIAIRTLLLSVFVLASRGAHAEPSSPIPSSTASSTVDITDVFTWFVLVLMVFGAILAWARMWRWIDRHVVPALNRVERLSEGPGLVAWTPAGAALPPLFGEAWLQRGAAHAVIGDPGLLLPRAIVELLADDATVVAVHHGAPGILDLDKGLAAVAGGAVGRVWILPNEPGPVAVAALADKGNPSFLVTDTPLADPTRRALARLGVTAIYISRSDPGAHGFAAVRSIS